MDLIDTDRRISRTYVKDNYYLFLRSWKQNIQSNTLSNLTISNMEKSPLVIRKVLSFLVFFLVKYHYYFIFEFHLKNLCYYFFKLNIFGKNIVRILQFLGCSLVVWSFLFPEKDACPLYKGISKIVSNSMDTKFFQMQTPYFLTATWKTKKYLTKRYDFSLYLFLIVYEYFVEVYLFVKYQLSFIK